MGHDAAAGTRFLLEALAARLQEARERLDEIPALAESAPPAALSPEDAEETLRAVMVNLWPKVRRGEASSFQKAEYFAALMRLAPRAETDDPRFLDAWNNAYEAAVRAPWTTDETARLVAPFLRRYAALLEKRAERLRC